MDEKTCNSCFWFTKRYDIHGFCRHPRNSVVASAGEDYSRSDVLRPIGVRINQVCDLHEKGESAEIRTVFEVESKTHYPYPSSDGGLFNPYGYKVEWRRVDTGDVIE